MSWRLTSKNHSAFIKSSMACSAHWGFFMVSTLTTQRLFAFCILLKCKQRNGVVFISDSRRKQASKLGMSLDSFNKYLNRAIDQELFINSGSNLQMIGTSQILKKLGLLPKSKKFHFLLNLQDCKKMNLSQLTEWVRESLVLYSFVQQQYKINKALEQIQSLEDFLNPKKTKQVKYSFFKRMQKKSAQLGISLPEYLKRVKKAQKKVVVTGSQHLSKSFKNCSSTMNKAINKLAKKGMIKRDIKKVPLKEFDLSNASFDTIKSIYGVGGLIINYKHQHFVKVIGSEIQLNFTTSSK